MDPMNSFLGRMLLEEISPVVMVLSTPLAEDVCQKNGLNFVQMLEPFCHFNRLDVPVRTASDQPYRLQMFKLRLFYASDMRPSRLKAAEERIKQIVNDASDESFSDPRSDPPKLENLLNSSEAHSCPLWIQTFNKELIRNVSFSEHEAFDHPVACLLVVSSEDEQPISKFVDLFDTDRLPSLFNEGVIDPKILKHYLLLHDKLGGALERATNILAEMRGTFGSNACRLLGINSTEHGGHGWENNPWELYRMHSSPNQNVARYLDNGDVTEMKDLMQDLCSKHIIPHMEQKIRILNLQVSATRKGFRNQIKNLWWRKGKDDMPDTPNGPTYSFSSIESQMRVLGDYAFMLRDYELALSNYRLLSTDYKLDKAWKRFAGVQEMIGLSYFMLDQSTKESENCMENALNTYLKIGSLAQRNATRCGLWWTEMFKARDQYKEAATVYFRIHNEIACPQESSLHAAVILEQAAYCYLSSSPPMLRKYGFHLVLAGNCYQLSDQRKHAVRAYRNALCVYKEHAWNFVHNHVHFNIGRWYSFLGIHDVAIKHMLEVLECSQQSLKTQDAFLSDFLRTAQSLGKAFEVSKLQLPVIVVSSLKVMYEDQRTYASLSDIGVSESVWQSLEEDMVPSVSTIKYNWLESQPQHKKMDDSCVCLVGEPIKLELEFKNPLGISISASGVSLICELSRNGEARMLGSGMNDSESRESTSSRGELEISEVEIVLEGGESRKVQLDVTPKVEGILQMVGIKWMLLGSVMGYHYFETEMKKKIKKRRHQSKKSLVSLLKFVVIKGLPKLDGCIHNLPSKIYAGDLRLLKLELQNSSEYHAKNMKMKISHPRFLIPGNSEEVDINFPDCLEKKRSGGRFMSENRMASLKNLLFTFPHDTLIMGEATFIWPLWFHCGFPGYISFFISLYYEMENCYSDMAYRILRMHRNVEVLPSLDVSFSIAPYPSRLEEFLVRMDIANKTSSESFNLEQLSSFSDQWEISVLPSDISLCMSKILLSREELSYFFKIKDSANGKDKKCKLSENRSDILLSSNSSNDVLVDVSQSPLSCFHCYEKLYEGKKAQGHRSEIDFILISKLQGNGTHHDPEVVPWLLVYHSCNYSITSKSPIWWLMDGPRIVKHDFASCFCEVDLCLTIHNSSHYMAHVKIVTSDSMSDKNLQSSTVPFPEPSGRGWYDASLTNDVKIVSSLQGSRSKLPSTDGISAFMWCSSSSKQFVVQPGSTSEVPFRVCIFSPGTYDFSNYELQWKLESPEGEQLSTDVKRLLSGTFQGHPFCITILQSL